MNSEQWGAGDPSKWSDWGSVKIGKREMKLIWGEHKHHYSDNKMYVVPEEGEPIDFDGHRILTDVVLRSRNYLKESELSGNEYRKGGTGEILADGEVIYEFFFRDIQWALLKAHNLIGELSEHSSSWMVKKEREKLIGRKIYYERTPAIISRLITEQGCLMLKADNVGNVEPLTAEIMVSRFEKPVYLNDGEEHEYEDVIKVEVLDPKIWWFRN